MTARLTLRRLVLPAALLILLVGGPTGCGRSAGTVIGKVTYQGSPLVGGTVILHYEDQKIFHGPIGPDGTYTIPDVPPGPALVTVSTPAKDHDWWQQRMKTPPAHNGPVVPAHLRPVGKGPAPLVIPDRYRVPGESGLTVTVDLGVTVFDINLTR